MSRLTKKCSGCGHLVGVSVARCGRCGFAFEGPESIDPSLPPPPEPPSASWRIEWRWVLIALGIFAVLQAPPLLLLHMQSIGDLSLAMAAWMVGGILVGYLSPGKTFLEPAVAAIVCSVLTVLVLAARPSGAVPSVMTYVVAVLGGVLAALVGAFIGEKAQDRLTARKPTR